jgi:hypothetical protein
MALADRQIRAAAVQKIQAATVGKPPEEVAVVPPTSDAVPVMRKFPGIVVTDGVVSIKGAVKDDAARNEFFKTIQKTPGVRSVSNELVLAPDTSPPTL